jgi:hypothetical protein
VVALQLGDAHQGQERQQQLVERRDGAVGEDRRTSRVQPRGEVVQHDLAHVGGDVAGVGSVGDHLVVGDHDVRCDSRLLQEHPVAQGAEVVPQVQRPGRSVAGQHPVALGAGADVAVVGNESGGVARRCNGRRCNGRCCHGVLLMVGTTVDRRPGEPSWGLAAATAARDVLGWAAG